jgi:hypothetical protein
MTLLSLALLLLCVLGGLSGAAIGYHRRDVSAAMLGLLVVAVAVCGLMR